MRHLPNARAAVVSLFLLLGASAYADVVISQVYGGGGNSGAPLANDFVELFNRGPETVALGGLSLQYASATGTGNIGNNTNQRVTLPSEALAPGQYFLIELAGGSNGVPLPTADAVGGIAMAAGSGKVVLVTGVDSLGCNGGSTACDPAQFERIVDLVGYGGANFFSGSAAAPALNNSTAAFRLEAGCSSTNDNAADFVTGAPAPRNTASPVTNCEITGEPIEPIEPEPEEPPPSTAIPYRIHEIQADGLGSPLLGEEVVTEGLVTARRTIGYFIQSAPGEEDGDAGTSEGLFVFTGNNVPDDAEIGNRVRVTGRVGQFVRAPHGYPLTQLTGTTLEVLASGEPLPEPVLLAVDDLSPDGFVGRLGRYQGMRVTLPAGRVTGPTNRFGDFYVTLLDVPRPFREPGIAVLDEVPLPPEFDIPRWDRNPERLRVESTGLEGGMPLFLDTGVVVENLNGVMYFDRNDFTLLIGDLPELTLAGGGAVPAPLMAAAAEVVSIASFNIENLGGGANVPAPRLDKLSQVFCQFLDLPEVVGLIEIADLATLERLAAAINEDEFGHCPESPAYAPYLLAESGNQRLGFLVTARPVANGQPRIEVIEVTEEYADERLVAPDGSTASGPLFDRPPLRLTARVHGDNGQSLPLNVLLTHNLSLLAVNDLRSRNDAWLTAGNRSRNKRLAQAVRFAELAETVQVQAPGEPLFLIGDFNAFEFSDGYADVMGVVTGQATALGEVLVHADSPLSAPLHNLTLTLEEDMRYSFIFQGSAQSLDHIVVNDAVLATGSVMLHPLRVNSDFAADNAERTESPLRTSDHDPIVARLEVPVFLDADLAVALATPRGPLLGGSEGQLPIEVRNLGPERAESPEVALWLDVPAERISGVAGDGWACGGAAADLAGSRVDCRRDRPLAAGHGDTLVLSLQIVREQPRDALNLRARVSTASNDPVASNDEATVSVRIAGRPAGVPRRR